MRNAECRAVVGWHLLGGEGLWRQRVFGWLVVGVLCVTVGRRCGTVGGRSQRERAIGWHRLGGRSVGRVVGAVAVAVAVGVLGSGSGELRRP